MADTPHHTQYPREFYLAVVFVSCLDILAGWGGGRAGRFGIEVTYICIPKVNQIGTQVLCNNESGQDMPITCKVRSTVSKFCLYPVKPSFIIAAERDLFF